MSRDKYEPSYRTRRLKRHFVSDQELQFLMDIFDQGPRHPLGKSNVQLHWEQRFTREGYFGGVAARLHVNEYMYCNRFANLFISPDIANKHWSCESSGSAGPSEIVSFVESTLQTQAGLAVWASSYHEDDIGYCPDYSNEDYRYLVPVTFEGIMRMPLSERITFATECSNWACLELREIIGLTLDQIEEILDISSICI